MNDRPLFGNMTEAGRLLQDSRLADGARLIGLLLLDRPAGEWQEIGHAEFARLLHGCPSPDTIGNYTRQLEVHGYIESRHNGRRPRQYRVIVASAGERREKLVTAGERTQTPLHPLPSGHNATVVVVVDDVEKHPPISPLFEKAMEQHSHLLTGCRDALRDYVLSRVEQRHQPAYVQSVASWLNGLDAGVWQRPDGSNLPRDRCVEVLAVALNELGATDETKMKRPVGDVGNLRTKINILLKQAFHEHTGNGKRSGGRAAGKAVATSSGAGDQSGRRKRDYSDE